MTNDPQALVDRAIELHNEGQDKEALSYLDRALKIDKTHSHAWYCRAIVLAENNHPEKAIECYRRAAKHSPDRAHVALYNMGNTYQEMGDLDRAYKCFSRATELAPDMADAWINKGRLLDDAGRHQDAVNCYDRALEHEAEDPVAWANRGNSLRALEQFQEAVNSYKRAIGLEPRNQPALAGLAACFGKLGDPQGGLELLRQVPSRDNSPELLVERSILQAGAEQWSEALRSIDQAMQMGAATPEIWNNRGEILARLKKSKSALASFNEALKLDNRFAPAWFGKARLLFNNEYLDQAKKCIDNFFKVAEDDDPLMDAARAIAAGCEIPAAEVVAEDEEIPAAEVVAEDDEDSDGLIPLDEEGQQVIQGAQLPLTHCECCQREVREYVGQVKDQGKEVANYWLHLPSAHPGQFYLAILRDSPHGSDRRIMVLGGTAQAGGLSFSITDPDESPWSQLDGGRIVSREEGLALEDRADFFQIADLLVVEDDRLRDFVVPHLAS